MSRRSKKHKPPKNRNLQSEDKTISASGNLVGELSQFSRSKNGTVPLWKHNESGTQNPYVTPALCGFLLLSVVLVFGQTVRHEFINFDDNNYVYENPQVTHGLTAQGIAWAFTHVHASNWHPLTWLSHMLDCQLYGLKPWGHHLTNVLLHAATAILLFLVLRRMTGDLWPSAFVAAVFAIHPLRAESVAWVAERKDVLSGLFFMLTLWAYVGYVRHPFSLARYLTVMVLFALGLMAKPMLVTLPFVLLLLDYWPLGRMASSAAEDRPVSGSWRSNRFSIPLRLAMEKVPLLMLAAASCAVTLWAQSQTIADNEHMPLSLGIGNAAVSYVAYLGQLFYPADLAVLYPHPGFSLSMWKVAGALLVLAAICVGVVVWRRRCPYVLVGWLWFMGMLLPVIGLVQVGVHAMADRYTYLTQIGLCIAIVWGIAQVCQYWPYRRWVCGASSALVLAILMGCAWHQTSYWHDSETLWTHTLACTSQNFVAYNNLGGILSGTGRQQDGIDYIEHSLRINPNNAKAHNNLGVALAQVGQTQEAIEHYEQALRLNPDDPKAHYNLGNALTHADRQKEAIEHYQQALRLEPNYIEVRNNLGNALIRIGWLQEAIAQYEQVVRLKPDDNTVYVNLMSAYAKTGRSSDAIATAEKALELARSQGKTAQAKQIEDWLNSYRASLSDHPNTPPPSKSALPPP